MSNKRSARLLRAIANELAQEIMPALESADAKERAGLAKVVLDYLAADLDVLTETAAEHAADYRQAIETVLEKLPASHFAAETESWRANYAEIPSGLEHTRPAEVSGLRELAAAIMRQVSDVAMSGVKEDESAAVNNSLAVLGRIDHEWLERFDAARAEQSSTGTGDQESDDDAPPEVTVDTVSRYLSKRYPESPGVAATEVVPIPGGRSKKTFFISVSGCDALPTDFVMRQDYALKYEGTKVRDEFRPLSGLSKLNLPVPETYLLEEESTELGPPFMFMERLAASAPRTYFGIQQTCPGAFVDLARALGQLHRVDAADLGMRVEENAEDNMLRLIDTYQAKWRNDATRPSPLVDFAFAWARLECVKDPGQVSVVHGDAGPYNFLVEDDRLTALLDWEFAHIGDPAEDLGIARLYINGSIEWPEFLTIYQEAGGYDVPDRRVRVGMLMQYLKGASLVATSGRNFEEGGTHEFIKGGSSFTGLRMIEARISALLRDLGAVLRKPSEISP